MNNKKGVVITGIGPVSPNAIGADDFKEAMKAGRSGIKKITLFDTSGLRSRSAGEISDFRPEDFLGKKKLRTLNRSTKLTLSAAKLAFEDAGLKTPIAEDKSCGYGVSVGTATGSMHSIVNFDKEILLEGPSSPNPAHFSNTVMNVAASYVSIWFNIRGFNATIASSLCSGIDALFYAAQMIRDYGFKVVVAGGVDELCLETFLGFYKTGILSGSRAGTEEFISCPYDKRRNGVIFSEGACMLILEDAQHAKSRNAKIYAAIEGYGSAFDPKSTKICNLNADGASLAITKALSDSGIKRSQIDLVSDSANSTKDGDIMATNAIKNSFGEDLKNISVTSIKSMIGEAFSAGSAFNVAASAISIKENFIPPTINYSVVDTRCDLPIVKNRLKEMKVDHVVATSFSSTGENSALVLGSYSL